MNKMSGAVAIVGVLLVLTSLAWIPTFDEQESQAKQIGWIVCFIGGILLAVIFIPKALDSVKYFQR
jgi:hypothetical protein